MKPNLEIVWTVAELAFAVVLYTNGYPMLGEISAIATLACFFERLFKRS